MSNQLDNLLNRFDNLSKKQIDKIGASAAGVVGAFAARRSLLKALKVYGYSHDEAKIVLRGLTAGAYLLTTQVYSAWKNLDRVYA